MLKVAETRIILGAISQRYSVQAGKPSNNDSGKAELDKSFGLYEDTGRYNPSIAKGILRHKHFETS